MGLDAPLGLDMPRPVLAKAAPDFLRGESELFEGVRMLGPPLTWMLLQVCSDLHACGIGHGHTNLPVNPFHDSDRVIHGVAEINIDELPRGKRVAHLQTPCQIVLQRCTRLTRGFQGIRLVTHASPETLDHAGVGWKGRERITMCLYEHRIRQ